MTKGGLTLEEEKLAKFRQAVFSDVDAKIEKIKKETESVKKASLAQTEDEQLNDAYGYIQDNVAKIKNEFKLEVSKKDLAARQEILLERERYRNLILQAIRCRLSEFSKTEEYKTYLLERYKLAATQNDMDHAVVSYKPEDHWFEQAVKTACPEQNVLFQPDFRIKMGGFIIRNEQMGFLIDETFESKLEEQMPYFNQNCRISAE